MLRRARGSLAVLALVSAAAAAARAQEQAAVPNPQWGAFVSGKNERVPMEPEAWPWQAIGRVNIVDYVQRRFCTGTLVGARLVLTAGHCLYNHRLGHWIKAENVHFMAGQARDAVVGQSVAAELIIPPDLDIAGGTDPRLRSIRSELIALDWALIVLKEALPVKPVPVRAIAPQAFAQEAAAGEVVRAGYGGFRQFLLSVNRGCAAAYSDRWARRMVSRCGFRRGESGSPLLLFRGEEAFVVGLATSASDAKHDDANYVAPEGLGPSAAAFAEAVARAAER
jgi:protease YdgD